MVKFQRNKPKINVGTNEHVSGDKISLCYDVSALYARWDRYEELNQPAISFSHVAQSFISKKSNFIKKIG